MPDRIGANKTLTALTFITIVMALLPSGQPLNPLEVGISEIRDRFSPTKGDSLQEFEHVQIVQEGERARTDDRKIKDEKSKERWKTKYTIVKGEREEMEYEEGGEREMGGGEEVTTRRHHHQFAGHDVYPTRQSRYESSLDAGFQTPTSISSSMATTKRLYRTLFAFYLPDELYVNPECQRDLKALDYGIIHIEDLAPEGILWPLKKEAPGVPQPQMKHRHSISFPDQASCKEFLAKFSVLIVIDSWGKWADGILNGNFNFMGAFQECLNITVQEDGEEGYDEGEEERIFDLVASFRGKYCSISYMLRSDINDTLEISHRPTLRVPMVVASTPQFLPILSYSTCMPSTCTQQELRDSLSPALFQSGYELQTVKCQTEDEHHELSPGEIFGIVFFSILGIILLSASVIDVWADYYAERNFKSGPVKYLLVFSVPFNIKKLFYLETVRNRTTITCLHGMRFLSICWVVLGHQYVYSSALAANIAELPEIINKVAFQMIGNGDLSVDTFFFMSGLLVTMGVLSQLHKTGKFNVPVYYIHRIVRLLPPIAIFIAFMATLSGFFAEGPLSWYYRDYILKGCKHSWWMDVSFVSNFMFTFLEKMNKENEAATCMPHCWFVGVDMQLYIVTPLMVLPLYFWKKRGLIVLGLWTAASVIIPASITAAFDLWPASMLLQDTAASLEYNHKVYLMPWCRAGPYIIGIWTGYVIHIAKDSPTIKRMSKFQIFIGWVSATVVALSIIFGIARYNKLAVPSSVPEMSVTEAALYGGFHRAVWGIVLAWIVLACHWGYGGPINWFLSHPLWQPLSRLTYCIYLTSLPIQELLITSNVTPTYFSYLMKIQETCGAMFITFLVSIALSLISEAPILRLEKLILYNAARRTESNRISTHQLTVEIDDKSDTEEEVGG
ncbi:hypothetical protein SK128_013072 [Halocaridina rubra]|uniref:Nose resistant-to-fluoxetine protein N-terminal domain-containing protein n=1 Tax=Halocaridina rubra TaxID=373956 RepID=A0AAN8WWS7_HALRR